MKKRRLLQSGKLVSEIGLGCMSFAGFYGPTDEKEAHNTLDTALDCGICLLYTSPSPRDPKTSRMPSSA